MTVINILSILISTLSLISFIYLTYKISRSNEAITQLEIKRELEKQPNICFWINNQNENGLVEIVIVNLGGKEALIKKMEIEVPNHEVDYMYIEDSEGNNSISNKQITDTVLKSGIIYKMFFKLRSLKGSYQFKILIMSYDTMYEFIEMNMSTLGPYYLIQKDFFNS